MAFAVFAALALLARIAIADRVNTALEITGDTHMKAVKSNQVKEMSEIKDQIRDLHKRVDRLEAAQVGEAMLTLQGTSTEGQGANKTAKTHITAALDARASDEEKGQAQGNGICCGAIDHGARKLMYKDFKWKAGHECKKAWHNTHIAEVDDICCNRQTPGEITRADYSTNCMPDATWRATKRQCWTYHRGQLKDDNNCYCDKDFQHDNEETQVGWLTKDTSGQEAVLASWWEYAHYQSSHCGPGPHDKFPFLSGCECMPMWQVKDGRQIKLQTWSPSLRAPADIDLTYD